MSKPYELMTRVELVVRFCESVPDLYMDLLVIAKQVDRAGLIRILKGIDRDRNEGRKGRLGGLPPWPLT